VPEIRTLPENRLLQLMQRVSGFYRRTGVCRDKEDAVFDLWDYQGVRRAFDRKLYGARICGRAKLRTADVRKLEADDQKYRLYARGFCGAV